MSVSKSCLVLEASKLDCLKIDGPSLSVSLLGQARRLFPFKRLSRIHIIGTTQNINLEPFVLCAEQQIPVAFFSNKGRLRCQLYYPVFEESFLAHWLDKLEYDAVVGAYYKEWLECQTLHLVSLMGKSHGTCVARMKMVQERCHESFNRVFGGAYIQTTEEWLSGFVVVHFSQILVDFGLNTQNRFHRKIENDLMPIVMLWLKYQFFIYQQNKKIRTINGRTMSEFFMEVSGDLSYELNRMLFQLNGRLESII